MKAKLLKKMFDRPIAYHRALVPFAGVTGAVMLSQAIYWSKRLEEDREGWFYKTRDEWTEETGLSRKEQETARKKLTKLGILEEKLQGIPAQLWFRVNFEVLQTCLLESDQQVGTKVTNKEVRKSPTYYTEITPDITTNKKNIKKPSENHPSSETEPSSDDSPSFKEKELPQTSGSLSNGSELSEYLQQKALRKAKRKLKKKYNGSIPDWVDVEKEAGIETEKLDREAKRVSITQAVPKSQEFVDFLKWLKSINRPTTYHPETEENWNRVRKTFEVAEIRASIKIALLDDFWKDHFNLNTFLRPNNYNGDPQDNVGSFYQKRSGGNYDIMKIKQEMKNELEQ